MKKSRYTEEQVAYALRHVDQTSLRKPSLRANHLAKTLAVRELLALHRSTFPLFSAAPISEIR